MGENCKIKKLNFQQQSIQYKPMKTGAERREKKATQIETMYKMFGDYNQIILTNFTNVGSSQIQQIRKMLRPYNGHLVIAKNTVAKKVLKMRTEGIEEAEFEHLKAFGGLIPELAVLIPLLVDKVALIFSDASVFELKSKIEANKVPTEARVGIVAPIDYTVPPGPTGMDPSQISFFHALNISTKIVRGQIEITKEFKASTLGKKVKASEAILLKKLNVKPFEYGMKVLSCYDEGSILPKEVLNLDSTSILAKFQEGVKNLAGLSIESGYAIEAVVPFIIGNAFKNIAALSIESGYKIKELEGMGSAPVTEKAGKKEEKKKAAEPVKAPEPEVVEEEMDMGGLFD